MASKKSKRTRKVRDFWSRSLQADKVRTALENMGGDFDTFEKAYKATSRQGRGRKARPLAERFTAEQVHAIQNFRGNGGIEGLATELSVTVSTARRLVSLAVEQGLI